MNARLMVLQPRSTTCTPRSLQPLGTLILECNYQPNDSLSAYQSIEFILEALAFGHAPYGRKLLRRSLAGTLQTIEHSLIVFHPFANTSSI